MQGYKNSMGKKKRICLLLCMICSLSACAKAPDSDIQSGVLEPESSSAPFETSVQNISLEMIAPESELTILPSETRVSEFIKCAGYMAEEDDFYNITPDFIADNSSFEIFKDARSTDSFIMYDGEVYSTGICFGGFGVTSMALADLNQDGEYELYYTSSFGSGVHALNIGYFDPVKKEVTQLDFDLLSHGNELMLTVNESGDLCVNIAVIDENSYQSFVDFSLKAQERIGTIVFTENTVTLHMDLQEDRGFSKEPENDGEAKVPSEEEIAALGIPEDMLAYWMVLSSKQPFVSTDEGYQAFYWDEYFWRLGEVSAQRQADDFMIVDMDGDGADEIVLYCSPESTQLLHYEDGVVYSYQFVFRGMKRIHESGIYEGSNGAASTSYYRLTELNRDGYTEEEIACVDDGYYVVEGKETSYEAFCDYAESIESVELAECIEFTESLLDYYLLGNLSEQETALVKRLPQKEMTESEADYREHGQALQLYAAVLTGEEDVIFVTEDTFAYADEAVVLYFSMVDMDGDGVLELVFTCEGDAVLILHYAEGKVYGYRLAPYRLKYEAPLITTDGVFQTDDDALSATGYARIAAFEEDGCRIEPVRGYKNGSYDRIRYYVFSEEVIAEWLDMEEKGEFLWK